MSMQTSSIKYFNIYRERTMAYFEIWREEQQTSKNFIPELGGNTVNMRRETFSDKQKLRISSTELYLQEIK